MSSGLRRTLITLLLSGCSLMSPVFAEEHCGRVSIAAFTWTSAEFLAHLDKIILSKGFGCEAVVVPGDTVPSTNSMMAIGEPNIAPEVWINSIREPLRQGVEDRLIRFAGRAFASGGEEGFWIPASMVAANPELATIDGVLANASMFKTGESAKFWGCPVGWACHTSVANLFKALKLGEAGFELVVPESSDHLAQSISSAFEENRPWFGYYWSPTALLGKYALTKVDFGSGVDADHFRTCIGKVGCKEPKPTMYPPSSVWTLVSEEFGTGSVAMMSYLGARSFENELMSSVLAWVDANDASAEAAALHFLREYPEVWSGWVSSDIAAKVAENL